MRCSFSIKIRKGVPFLAPLNPRFSPSEAPAKPPAWIPALDKMPGHRTPPPQASPRPAKMPRSRANSWIISSSYALLFIPDKSGSKPCALPGAKGTPQAESGRACGLRARARPRLRARALAWGRVKRPRLRAKALRTAESKDARRLAVPRGYVSPAARRHSVFRVRPVKGQAGAMRRGLGRP